MATSIEWPSGVNTNFFDLKVSVKDNVKKLTFESGKERRYLLNSSPKKKLSFSFSLWNETEEAAFWDWYNNTILSGSLSFKMTDLITKSGNTEYFLTETPSVEDIFPKTVSLSLEEY